MKRSSSGLSLFFVAFLCLAIATVSNFHSNEQTSLLYAQLIFFKSTDISRSLLYDGRWNWQLHISPFLLITSAYPGKDACKVRIYHSVSVSWLARQMKCYFCWRCFVGWQRGTTPRPVVPAPGSPWIQAGIVSCWGNGKFQYDLESISNYLMFLLNFFFSGCVQPQYPGVYTRVTSFMNWIGKNALWGRIHHTRRTFYKKMIFKK